MTDDEFDAFLTEVTEALRLKQAALGETYALGEMGRWWFEQERALLQFFDSDESLALEADVIVIGTFSPASDSWQWAWSNPSLVPDLRDGALVLRQLQAVTGFDIFSNGEVFAIAGEAMAWEFAAAAVHHLGAIGCYRAPSVNGPHTFLAITQVKVVSGSSPGRYCRTMQPAVCQIMAPQHSSES